MIFRYSHFSFAVLYYFQKEGEVTVKFRTSKCGEVENFSKESMNVLKLYNQFKAWPFGKTIFSYLFAIWAPYFLTIRPYVEDLRPGFGKIL